MLRPLFLARAALRDDQAQLLGNPDGMADRSVLKNLVANQRGEINLTQHVRAKSCVVEAKDASLQRQVIGRIV